MAQLSQEYTDYNKMFHTSSGDPGYNYNPQTAYMHPLASTQSVQSSVRNNHNISNSNLNGYGPLDFGYGMTPTATTFSNVDVNMAPFTAPNAATSQRHHYNGKGSAGRRRSSISDFFSSIVGGDSRGREHHTRSSISKLLSPGEHRSGDNLGRRRSSAYLSMGFKTDADGNEHKGPYAHVSRRQAEHMERIREAERNLHLTHNVDGLPLPNNQALGLDPRQRRRSSLARALGFDKPLLAR